MKQTDQTNQEVIPKPLREIKRDKLFSLVKAGHTVTKAAELAGISRCHASRLVNNNPEVSAQLMAEINEILEMRLPILLSVALDYLEKTIESDNMFVSRKDKLKAAQIIATLTARSMK